MGIQLKIFRLLMNRPEAVYLPGDVVSGHCIIELDGQVDLCQLCIKLNGEATTSWKTRISGTVFSSGINNQEQTVSHGTRYTIVEQIYSPESVYPTVLNAGQHNIAFTFQLPAKDLPSSFESTSGHIRYTIEAKIKTSEVFTKDKKTQFLLSIVNPLPALVSMDELLQPVMYCNQKTVGFFNSGKVLLKCQINRSGHNIGSSIEIKCFVDNQSKKSMTLRASLKQLVKYYGSVKHHSKCDSTQSTKKLVKVIGSTFSAHNQHKEVILLPIHITNTDENICSIISIKYVVIVTLVIPGSIDLHCELPVILTTGQSYNL